MKTLIRATIVMSAMAVFCTAHATELIFYSMNDLSTTVTNPLADVDAVVGVPSLTLAGGSLVGSNSWPTGTAFTDANGTNYVAGRAAGWTSGVNDTPSNTFTLQFNSTGFENFIIRYDYRSTSTGATGALMEYRVGGSGSFTTIQTDTFTRDSAFHSISNNFFSLSSIENASNVEIRWTFNAGTSTGTTQIDNLEVLGTALIPEPSTLSLVGLALIPVFFRRRR